MVKLLKHLALFALGALFLLGCDKKDKSAVVEEDLLPQEDVEIIDELAEEISDETDSENEVEVKFSTIPKKPKTINQPKTKAQSNSPSTQSDLIHKTGEYVVQISIYKLASAANKVKNRLIAKGFPAYVAEITDPTPDLPGTYYRVRVGYFKGLSKAKAFGEKFLEPQGYSFWADLASNDNIITPSENNYSAVSEEPTPEVTQEPAASASEPEVEVEPSTPNPSPAPTQSVEEDDEW